MESLALILDDMCLHISWPLLEGQPLTRREKEKEGDLKEEDGDLEEKRECFIAWLSRDNGLHL